MNLTQEGECTEPTYSLIIMPQGACLLGEDITLEMKLKLVPFCLNENNRMMNTA